MATKSTCGHPDRKVFSKKRCKQCAVADSIKKYQQNQRLKEKNPISQVSDNRKALNKIYAWLRNIFLTEKPLCLAKLSGCTIKATEIHHQYKRTGFWLLSCRYFLPICRNCHNKVNTNSDEAIQTGLSISRHSKPVLAFRQDVYDRIVKAKLTDPKIDFIIINND